MMKPKLPRTRETYTNPLRRARRATARRLRRVRGGDEGSPPADRARTAGGRCTSSRPARRWARAEGTARCIEWHPLKAVPLQYRGQESTWSS